MLDLISLTKTYRFIPSPQIILTDNHFSLSQLTSSPLRILNWNIAKRSHRHHWIDDFKNILEEYQPDMLFLQEVRLNETIRHLLTMAMMGWTFAPNLIDRKTNTYSGVLTASKIKPLHTRSIFSDTHEPMSRTPKVSLLTEYSLPNTDETLLTINIHGINFVNNQKFCAQLQAVEKILIHHHGAILFLGDFNTWNPNRLTALANLATRLQLQPVMFAPDKRKHIKHFLRSPLDHIFYRGFGENRASAGVLNNIRSSDHKPLFVELTVTANTCTH
ncbi:endonuclease/exonuclease/phosphatase family protein [Beggiatoa leptomitoformis]|uniref:Endonuclease/exonuclease/phosphatase family protein n=1 Tax=Beggiatoa leptomitoformis TaxID=288004 RepID=A0A2N9YEV8_9GAMM|nr:endonuclease/exonuclease/phosphatase family protein [Beggiatoa leptomitoformis]ALG68692.1 endonuclease/exonuclease/phosphatase family protein [Beggiatoa leptomitoformis]AUI68955.1 endonuclease/exonuclease/phosphatase family protein [Beggiatoa leptomitoformis]